MKLDWSWKKCIRKVDEVKRGRRMHLLAIACLPMLLSSFGCTAAEVQQEMPVYTAFSFNEAQQANRFIDVFKGWANDDRSVCPGPEYVLCVGSSSMRMWKSIHDDLAPMKVIHRGFGGSTMADVLTYMDFFTRYPSRIVVVYEGDNDLVGPMTPEQYIAQCRQFVEAMRAVGGDREFYFMSVKPSIARWNLWEKVLKSNALLAAWCERGEHLHYVDVATPMIGEDGLPIKSLFLSDNLHMTAEGYLIWKNALRNALFAE
ncbi:MAG: hypothetical protein JXR25_00005 [Pontiellaceae bacterium]|nr:hypothetical protein [Pontiellaceae bacterium]